MWTSFKEKDMKKYHVGLTKVLPPEKRDVFRSLDPVSQQSWKPTTGQQDEIGQPTEYTILLDDYQLESVKLASNCEYVVPVREESIDGRCCGEGCEEKDESWWGRFVSVMGFGPGAGPKHPSTEEPIPPPSAPQIAPLSPNASTLAYINADGLIEQGFDGEGVVMIGADTGFSEKVKSVWGERFLTGRSFTSEPTTDDHTSGHGTGTGWMSTPPKALYMPYKVLRTADGSGGSDGITQSFYEAGKFAEAHPEYRVLYNGSFSGSRDQVFEPYVRALKYATDRGVVFVFSAGNDNSYRINSPANTSRVNPRVFSSIAFNRRNDNRASFSNYHETCTISGPGVGEPGYDQDGNIKGWNGTSFSAPWTTFCLAMLLTKKEGFGVGEVVEALKKNARDSAEPTVEEGGGVLDVKAALAKLTPPVSPVPDPALPPLSGQLYRVQEGVYSTWKRANDARNRAAAKSVALRIVPIKNLNATEGSDDERWGY